MKWQGAEGGPGEIHENYIEDFCNALQAMTTNATFHFRQCGDVGDSGSQLKDRLKDLAEWTQSSVTCPVNRIGARHDARIQDSFYWRVTEVPGQPDYLPWMEYRKTQGYYLIAPFNPETGKVENVTKYMDGTPPYLVY